MSRSETKHWIVALIYSGLLWISLAAFLADPAGRSGTIALNALFQSLGPTLGTFILAVVSLVQMLRKKISVASGVGAIALLAAVSLVCIAMAFPILMGI